MVSSVRSRLLPQDIGVLKKYIEIPPPDRSELFTSFIAHPTLHLKRRRGSVTTLSCFLFQEVAEGISNIEGLCLVGDPKAMVVCFRGVDGLNIYSVVSVCGL